LPPIAQDRLAAILENATIRFAPGGFAVTPAFVPNIRNIKKA